MYFIFNQAGQFISTCDFEPNFDDLATRGEQAVESEQNFTNPMLIDGNIIEIGIAPSKYHQLIGTKWVISDDKQIALIADVKTALLAAIAAKTDNFKAQYLQGYSQAEIDSFYRQEREARGELPLMMLTEIFEGRDDLTDINQLKTKVIQKADIFAIIMGKLFAIKQNFEAHIEQALTLEQLEQIGAEIEQWQSI